MVYDPEAEAKKLAKAAADRYKEQAESLQGQIKAQKLAVNTSFTKALTQRLANISQTYKQADAAVMKGYAERTASLDASEKDNTKALGDQAASSLTNHSRERMAALTQAFTHGAGESDVLKSTLMATRNLSANLSEGTRSAFDSLRAINQSQTDLNIDTRTARINAVIKANADRDAAYTDRANRMSDAYTQMGNIAQQQAELYGLANEQVKKDSYQDKQEGRVDKADEWFMDSARWAGEVFKNPGVNPKLLAWQGKGERKLKTNLGKVTTQGAPEVAKRKPEGATLRKWLT